MATKQDLFDMVDQWEADPDGEQTCDLLCTVLDALPGQPEGEFSAEEIRELIEASDLSDVTE